jgi:hypothetical protein
MKNCNKKGACKKKSINKKKIDINCINKCNANSCPKTDLKKPSKRNVKDPEIRKTHFVTGDKFPSCPPTDKDTFFYHQKKNMIFIYNRKTNEWLPAHCGSITVETGNTETGATTSGPFTLDTCGDTLRLWSAGGISAKVTPGSALVQMEPNIIFCGDDPDNFMPPDPTRPALFFNSATNMFFVWDPENENGTFENWHTGGGGGGTGALGDKIEVASISGKDEGALIVDKAVFTNVQGITKFYLDEDLFFLDFEDVGGALPIEEFVKQFNTIDDDFILNEEELYTLPPINSFNNDCLGEGEWDYLLEVNIKLNFRAGFFDYEEFDDYFTLSLVKNDEETVSQITYAPLVHYIGAYRTLSLNDTILCQPEDVLNIHLFKNEEESDGKVELLGGPENCVFVFRILGLQPRSEIEP